jgi:hypothetical protein
MSGVFAVPDADDLLFVCSGKDFMLEAIDVLKGVGFVLHRWCCR